MADNITVLDSTSTTRTLSARDVAGVHTPRHTVADGDDITIGAIADAAAPAGGTGTVSAKLRRLSTQLPAALGVAVSAASMPVTIASDQTLQVRSGIIVGANNSSTTPLGSGATFTGTGELIDGYQEITVNLAGAPTTAPGTVFMEFSPDNVNWDVSIPVPTTLSTFIPVALRIVLPYFRVRYVNGATVQTQMRLTTIFHYVSSKTLTRLPFQSITPTEPVENVRAIVDDGSSYKGRSPSSLLGDRTVFGATVTAERVSHLLAEFNLAISANAVTSTVTNGGTVAVSNGLCTLTTGTNVSGTAKLNTTGSIRYSPGREIYCTFTAAFTTPSHVNSYQRAGLYDANNGFFLGFEGTTFGVTRRSGAADTFVSSLNGDPMDGTVLSIFTSGGTPVVWDKTKLNVYRIRFGWLGAGSVTFEILSPDDQWVVIHAIRYPNTAAVPSIRDPNLPITMDAAKAAADAASLVISTSSWDAGTTESPHSFGPESVKGRTYVNAALLSQTTDQTLYTVTAGRTLRVTGLTLTFANTSTANAATLSITDGAGGALRFPFHMPAANATGGNLCNTVHVNLVIPVRFTTSVYCDVGAVGTPSYSVTITGYEAET